MKKTLIILCAALALSSCGTGKKYQDVATPPTVMDVNAAQREQAAHEPDAISQGAGEAEAITESNSLDRQPPMGAHAATYYFDFDNSAIHEEDKADLKAQIEFLKDHPEAKILLSGHTDEVGSREYNVALGERRANSVLNYLKFAGIKPSQIRVLSYGMEKPKALGHNQEAYRINRRVELTYEVA